MVKVNGSYTVVGVISWGLGPKIPPKTENEKETKDCGAVAVYAKVAKYLDFINSIK